MGKILIVKDVDYSNVAAGQVNVEGEGTVLSVAETISLNSVAKNLSNGNVLVRSSQTFSVLCYNVSQYVGGTLSYKNAIRNVVAPETWIVGACFFDANGDAIANTFVSHIYGSSSEGSQKNEVSIPSGAVSFKLSWKAALGAQVVIAYS